MSYFVSYCAGCSAARTHCLSDGFLWILYDNIRLVGRHFHVVRSVHEPVQ